MNRVAFVMVALTRLPLGCRRADAAPVPVLSFPQFEDITDQVGLYFAPDAGLLGAYFAPQRLVSGAVRFDFDISSARKKLNQGFARLRRSVVCFRRFCEAERTTEDCRGNSSEVRAHFGQGEKER